jgi:diguanylate cyclase (GGDEF)-like protein/PAS domain S-box-containing protein
MKDKKTTDKQFRETLKKEFIRLIGIVTEQLNDAIVVTNLNYEITYTNNAFQALYGYSNEEVLGRTPDFLSALPSPEKIKNDIFRTISSGGTWKGEVVNRRKDGSTFECELVIFPLTDEEGDIIAYAEHQRDITRRKLMEQKLREAAVKDDLTGLLNRRGFFSIAEKQCEIANRQTMNLYFLYVDVDGLKEINDKHGHEEGDVALVDTSIILQETFRASDIIARIGGDEYVVMAMETPGSNIEMLISRLQTNVETHNSRSSKPYKLSLSTGLTHFNPGNPCSVSELLSKADRQMYKQKKKHGGQT